MQIQGMSCYAYMHLFRGGPCTAGLDAQASLFEPAATTASLMLLSAFLGYSARALLQQFPALPSNTAEDRWSTEAEQRSSSAGLLLGDMDMPREPATLLLSRDSYEGAASSSDDSIHGRALQSSSNVHGRDDMAKRQSQAPSAMSASSPLRKRESSTPTPEDLWSAAWRGLDPPPATTAGASARPGTMSLTDRLLGRTTISNISPSRFFSWSYVTN